MCTKVGFVDLLMAVMCNKLLQSTGAQQGTQRKRKSAQMTFNNWYLVLNWYTSSDLTDMSLTSFALHNSNLEHKVNFAELF